MVETFLEMIKNDIIKSIGIFKIKIRFKNMRRAIYKIMKSNVNEIINAITKTKSDCIQINKMYMNTIINYSQSLPDDRRCVYTNRINFCYKIIQSFYKIYHQYLLKSLKQWYKNTYLIKDFIYGFVDNAVCLLNSNEYIDKYLVPKIKRFKIKSVKLNKKELVKIRLFLMNAIIDIHKYKLLDAQSIIKSENLEKEDLDGLLSTMVLIYLNDFPILFDISKKFYSNNKEINLGTKISDKLKYQIRNILGPDLDPTNMSDSELIDATILVIDKTK